MAVRGNSAVERVYNPDIPEECLTKVSKTEWDKCLVSYKAVLQKAVANSAIVKSDGELSSSDTKKREKRLKKKERQKEAKAEANALAEEARDAKILLAATENAKLEIARVQAEYDSQTTVTPSSGSDGD
jgi:hypothetical protein